jgi:hypothetical protein
MNNINVFIQGGLGNQIFMIFAAFSYAIDNNFNMNIYSHKDKHLVYSTRCSSVYWNNILDSFTIIDNNNNLQTYTEPEYKYNKIPIINTSFNIIGYYQSYKYFAHNYDKIINHMKLDNKQNEIKKEFEYLFKKKTIAIHFRLGDYKSCENNHNILKESYYSDALKHFKNISEDYDILYFCEKEDNNYVNNIINNLNIEGTYNFIKIDDDIPDWKQLLIMSLCDNFIIANSSFSWFGAYFSKNVDKIVLYPSKWFGENFKNNDTSDVCPPEWIKINTT